MQLSIRSRDFQLTDALRAHTTERFAHALKSASQRVSDVTVRLLRKARGRTHSGVMQCQVELHLEDGETLVLNECDEDLYAAISRAAGRSKQNVWKRIKARMKFQRR